MQILISHVGLQKQWKLYVIFFVFVSSTLPEMEKSLQNSTGKTLKPEKWAHKIYAKKLKILKKQAKIKKIYKKKAKNFKKSRAKT